MVQGLGFNISGEGGLVVKVQGSLNPKPQGVRVSMRRVGLLWILPGITGTFRFMQGSTGLDNDK